MREICKLNTVHILLIDHCLSRGCNSYMLTTDDCSFVFFPTGVSSIKSLQDYENNTKKYKLCLAADTYIYFLIYINK